MYTVFGGLQYDDEFSAFLETQHEFKKILGIFGKWLQRLGYLWLSSTFNDKPLVLP